MSGEKVYACVRPVERSVVTKATLRIIDCVYFFLFLYGKSDEIKRLSIDVITRARSMIVPNTYQPFSSGRLKGILSKRIFAIKREKIREMAQSFPRYRVVIKKPINNNTIRRVSVESCVTKPIASEKKVIYRKYSS